MNTYKLRAECQLDLGRLFESLRVESFQARTICKGFPDMEATFESPLSLAEVKSTIRTIVDGHVMLGTVALEAEYTGERIPQ